MPFGLKSAPAWFQRAMDKTLGAARWDYAIAYLDDIVVFSDTFEDHLYHVDNVLAASESAGLTVSPSKCYFGYDSVSLLGFKVSSLGLMTDEEKTRAVLEFPEPANAVEARRFFAMAAWYRRFVPNFASRARPKDEHGRPRNFSGSGRGSAAIPGLFKTHSVFLEIQYPILYSISGSGENTVCTVLELRLPSKSRLPKNFVPHFGAPECEIPRNSGRFRDSPL
ncbi:hypothetical protein A4X09_0g7282 [Tilletia walkeri]|uniref:Reverse transcriptase domain-containing protein n=1 Tax=Tilletia walkeri TaxID=117179 RepID=A0A8X7N276_9BASI|nr:hypothetical protein A4X09_0g7282 [Tilletia walkeri]